MAIPPNDMTLWNLLASKPDDVDRVNPVYDIDANEQKCQTYGLFKTFFVKTDEPTDIEAILEFQSTVTKPNSILKFGSAGEFHVYSDGTDLFVKGTTSAGKLRFYANSVEMLTLNPTNSSIVTQGMAINKDGTAGVGINFDSSNRPVLLSILQCDAGIATKSKNISYSGALNTGLEFDGSNNGIFMQQLTVNDLFNLGNNQKIGINYISYDGTNKGIHMDASNKVIIGPVGLEVNGDIFANNDIEVTGHIFASYYVSSDSYVIGSSYIRGGYLIVTDGHSTPTTTAGQAKIWVDSSHNVKIKLGDGTIKTFTLT
jgi:hypothetical protein